MTLKNGLCFACEYMRTKTRHSFRHFLLGHPCIGGYWIGLLEIKRYLKQRTQLENGHPLRIIGTCNLRIRLVSIDFHCAVLVAGDFTQDFLVGIDFLAKCNGLIKIEKGLHDKRLEM